MNRGSFLKNALMAVAVSLVPKVLRPMENLFDPGESLVSKITWFIPKYDPKKTYVAKYLGRPAWFSGAALNYMDEWERKRRKSLYDHYKKEK